MKKNILIIALLAAAFGCGAFVNSTLEQDENSNDKAKNKEHQWKLGAFSMSLNVKDLKKSIAFYETLGFKSFGGKAENNYVIMKNGNAIIGLFHGFFEGNILTFNPGWDENAKNMKKYDDIRAIQKHLKENGVELLVLADTTTTGPANLMLKDPDGNMILLDQHR